MESEISPKVRAKLIAEELGFRETKTNLFEKEFGDIRAYIDFRKSEKGQRYAYKDEEKIDPDRVHDLKVFKERRDEIFGGVEVIDLSGKEVKEKKPPEQDVLPKEKLPAKRVGQTQPQVTGFAGFTQEQINVIKRTVAKGATDDELAMFLSLASRYKLDPFAQEIWFVKYEKGGQTKTMIMTGRDGYLSIAQRDENFDGLLSGVVREGDEFEFEPTNTEMPVKHKFGKERGKIIGAWAVCYHKQRKPAIGWAEFEEYNRKADSWQNYPSAMIQKVAEVMVLKRQFGISGLVTKEEMGDE